MLKQVTLEAPDISCDHCISSIRQSVSALPGVEFLSGDPGNKLVVLQSDAAQVELSAVEQAMAAEGYPVKK